MCQEKCHYDEYLKIHFELGLFDVESNRGSALNNSLIRSEYFGVS